ncbi:MAG: hypothetical protein WAO19_12130 [Candidatus Kryptoniota bacterium]
MLCRSWRQIGFKPHDKAFVHVDSSAAKLVSFHEDGSYEEVDYGSLSFGGQWKFNADSTKFAIAINKMNGQTMGNVMSIDDAKPTDLIVRLMPDTLIYGMEAYYGAQKEYGHDDWYFVPANK